MFSGGLPLELLLTCACFCQIDNNLEGSGKPLFHHVFRYYLMVWGTLITSTIYGEKVPQSARLSEGEGGVKMYLLHHS